MHSLASNPFLVQYETSIFFSLLFRFKEHFNSSSSLAFSFPVFLPPIHILFPVSTVCRFYFSISFTSLQQMNSSYSPHPHPPTTVSLVFGCKSEGIIPNTCSSQQWNRYQTGYCFLLRSLPLRIIFSLSAVFISCLSIPYYWKWRIG